MEKPRNERLVENHNTLVISEATMSKSVEELEAEEKELTEAIKNLEKALKTSPTEKVVDFAQFKLTREKIRNELEGKKYLLEEVNIVLQIKKGKGVHDFTEIKEKKRA